MFNTVITNEGLIRSAHSKLCSVGTAAYPSLEQERNYLLSLYPITEFNIDNYLNNEECGYVKDAKVGTRDYDSLVHEAFITLHLADGISKVQKILDIKFTAERLYVIFDYIEGITLTKLIEEYFTGIKYSIDTLINILTSVFDQLNYLYSKYKFTHYDLHPGNIMIRPNNDIVIIDMEMAHIQLDSVSYGQIILVEIDIYTLIDESYYWPQDIVKLLCIIKRNISELTSTTKIVHEHIIRSHMTAYEAALNIGNGDRAIHIMEIINNIQDDYKSKKFILKEKLSCNVFIDYINMLLSYFMSKDKSEQHIKQSLYAGAPRLTLMDDHQCYLTSYKHFYEYQKGIKQLYD